MKIVIKSFHDLTATQLASINGVEVDGVIATIDINVVNDVDMKTIESLYEKDRIMHQADCDFIQIDNRFNQSFVFAQPTKGVVSAKRLDRYKLGKEVELIDFNPIPEKGQLVTLSDEDYKPIFKKRFVIGFEN